MHDQNGICIVQQESYERMCRLLVECTIVQKGSKHQLQNKCCKESTKFQLVGLQKRQGSLLSMSKGHCQLKTDTVRVLSRIATASAMQMTTLSLTLIFLAEKCGSERGDGVQQGS